MSEICDQRDVVVRKLNRTHFYFLVFTISQSTAVDLVLCVYMLATHLLPCMSRWLGVSHQKRTVNVHFRQRDGTCLWVTADEAQGSRFDVVYDQQGHVQVHLVKGTRLALSFPVAAHSVVAPEQLYVVRFPSGRHCVCLLIRLRTQVLGTARGEPPSAAAVRRGVGCFQAPIIPSSSVSTVQRGGQ